jgi:V/A-type H+-transporting ATPase subunit E
MSLHAILEKIRASGESRVYEIETRAYAQQREILSSARIESEALKKQSCSEAMMPATRERARILHLARLEALRTTGTLREALIDSAHERIHGYLAGIRSDVSYQEVLRRLLVEALDELKSSFAIMGKRAPANQICLEADPRDKEILENLLGMMDLSLPIGYTLNCWGGVIAKSEDGRVVVINTLEARLERAAPFLRRYLAALFEGSPSEVKDVRL